MLAKTIDGFFNYLSRVAHPGAACSLNLPVGNSGVIGCKDGSIVSVIEIRGSRHFIGLEEHEYNVNQLEQVLTPFYRSKGCDIGFYFEADTDAHMTQRLLDQIYAPTVSASKAIGLNNARMISEEISILKPHVQVERCWMVVWTRKVGFTQIAKADRFPLEARTAFNDKERQNLTGADDITARGSIHSALMDRLYDTFKYLKYSVRILSTAELARNIRNAIDSHKTGAAWEPTITGESRGDFVYPGDGRPKASHLMPPKLGYQVWPVEPDQVPHKPDTFRIGNRIFKVIAFQIMPNGRVPFNLFLKRLAERRIPFRFAGLMRSDASNALAVKAAFASALTILPFSHSRKEIRDEVERLKQIVRNERVGESALEISVVTWAENDNFEKLDYRTNQLVQIANAWKNADAYILKDDKLEGFMSTLPAYRNRSTAPTAAGTLRDILYLMPLTRPTLPFEEGSMCFLSEDGKAIPFQPFDYSVMRHHVYLVVGEPGYGKSAFLNNMLVSLVSSSNEVPYVGVADVGTSSLGSILLTQSLLPEGKKHLALYKRLRNRKEEAYNFMEPDYGLRVPLKEHLEEIELMLSLIMSDDRTGELHPEITGLISSVLRLAYRVKSDTDSKSDPTFFQNTHKSDPYWGIIHDALNRHDIPYDIETTWWQLFEALHDKGEFRAASLAQRFAAPTLPFLGRIVSMPEIREEFPGGYGSGTKLVDYFSRKIGEACENYPLLASITRLDLGEARIISLDLEDVVPRATGTDFMLKKKGAIFFTAAARILTSRFFWKEDRLTDIPSRYHSYHAPRIASIRRTTNALFIDEMQRFSQVEQANDLAIKITNEGRKIEVGVLLASQNVTEMPERLIQFSTAQFICGFEEKSVKSVVDKFDLNETERALIVERIRPPTKEGASLLVRFTADENSYSHLLRLKMGSEKLWGLSTRNRDSIVRSRIYDAFSDTRGRELLARVYPSGSVNDDYQTRLQRLSLDEDIGLFKASKEGDNTNITEQIIESLLKEGERLFYQKEGDDHAREAS